jgi:hypothetical protein
MDLTSALTVSAIVLANIGSTISLFIWATNRADTHTQNVRAELKAYSLETQAILKGIADEMKDFHGRLCAIEERNSTRIVK